MLGVYINTDVLETDVLAEDVEFLELIFFLNKTNRDANIIGVAVVVVCDDGCSEFVRLVGWSVSPATDGEPP
jgi:tellurite resistance protein